jgi:hypothetical protein
MAQTKVGRKEAVDARQHVRGTLTCQLDEPSSAEVYPGAAAGFPQLSERFSVSVCVVADPHMIPIFEFFGSDPRHKDSELRTANRGFDPVKARSSVRTSHIGIPEESTLGIGTPGIL